jgi:hypothetical protein
MLNEEEIKQRITALISEIDKNPTDRRRLAGVIEGYLCAVAYFTPGLKHGEVMNFTTSKILWKEIKIQEDYTMCMIRHAKNYLKGKPLVLNSPCT